VKLRRTWHAHTATKDIYLGSESDKRGHRSERITSNTNISVTLKDESSSLTTELTGLASVLSNRRVKQENV
jgi:general stress protein 26